ncbi:TrbC family F-type conjugative pilus assembly protein [Burkholderia ambifaria]|uniref:TrbC family F-type conjugative pilus assembly protein n=1 Tax=Burkholderia ambifaria TaxID=152480 RepID=UPI0013DF45A4|nr:TrbC family F-type conjugative pilus assembly protein [Burkholderia ambifaria]
MMNVKIPPRVGILRACAAAVLALSVGFAYADAGVDRMKSVMDAVGKGDLSALSAKDRRAVQTGEAGATAAASPARVDAQTAAFAQEQSADWQQLAKQAYVAALPLQDQALGRSILLGDGTVPGSKGQLYIFVSRSMPMSLLRAYALEALYTGAALVVRGIRPGQSVNDYVQEAVSDFNSADGQVLAGLEINPDLFDMFDVKMVPAVVWSGRAGLEDVGSGCTDVPEGTPLEKITLMGPDDQLITMDRPTCAKLPDSSYFKITGALSLPYVFDRFQEAGAPKDVMDQFRQELAEMAANGVSPAGDGHTMAQFDAGLKIEMLPRYVLRYWQRQLATHKTVQRAPYGPAFSDDGDDDASYRKELEEKIRKGLGG